MHIHSSQIYCLHNSPRLNSCLFSVFVCVLVMTVQHEHTLYVCVFWHVSPYVYAYTVWGCFFCLCVWVHLNSLDDRGWLLLANFLSPCNVEWWWGELEAEPELTSWTFARKEERREDMRQIGKRRTEWTHCVKRWTWFIHAIPWPSWVRLCSSFCSVCGVCVG